MPTSSLNLLLSFAFNLHFTTALPWAGPQETHAYRAENFSPAPTSVPDSSTLLFKRDSVPVNVCGWIAGRPESVARCGSGSSCIHDTKHGFIGCCATAGPCTDGVYTTCLDSGMEGWKSTQGLINNGVLTCKPSSTCFQNIFPGNYKQYSCGESNLGGTIHTTYDGQAKDMRLQVVYTGVNFSPMSKLPYTTVPFTPETTAPEAGKATPTPTAAAGATSPSGREETTGYIAGGTIGGVAVAAILIAGLVLFLRRRKRSGQRVGGFVSLHHKPHTTPSTPSLLNIKRLTGRYEPTEFGPIVRRTTAQEIAYMSPTANNSQNESAYLHPISETSSGTTYVSPFTGHPDESHQTPPDPNRLQTREIVVDRDLLMMNSPMSASTYNGGFPETYETGSATLVPISRLNVNHHSSSSPANSQSQSPQLLASDEITQQKQPLVGISIDDFGQSHTRGGSFGRGYAGVTAQDEAERDTHIHSGDMPEMTDIGLLGTMRRAASHIIPGNGRKQDLTARSESMRQSSTFNSSENEKQNPFSDVHEVQDGIWKSTTMNPPKLKEPEGMGSGLGLGVNWGGLLSSGGHTLHRVEEDEREVEKEEVAKGKEKEKVERPLMEQMMEAFNRGVSGASGPSPSTALLGGGGGGGGGAGAGLTRGQSTVVRKPVGGSLHRGSRSEI